MAGLVIGRPGWQSCAMATRHHEHLRGGGTSVVVEVGPDTLPRVLHWGPDLGELDGAELSALATSVLGTTGDSPVVHQTSVPLVPQQATGWRGRPGIAGSRAGRDWSPLFDSDARHERTSVAGTE